MSMSMRVEKDRVWVVTFVAKGRGYDMSHKATVIAQSIQSAIYKVLKEHPDAVITSAAHHGAVDIT